MGCGLNRFTWKKFEDYLFEQHLNHKLVQTLWSRPKVNMNVLLVSIFNRPTSPAPTPQLFSIPTTHLDH